jgi:hypothetical protein
MKVVTGFQGQINETGFTSSSEDSSSELDGAFSTICTINQDSRFHCQRQTTQLNSLYAHSDYQPRVWTQCHSTDTSLSRELLGVCRGGCREGV